MTAFRIDSAAICVDLRRNPPTTARRECCLCSAALLLCSAAQLLSLSTVDAVVLLGATAQKPPEQGHAPAAPGFHLSYSSRSRPTVRGFFCQFAAYCCMAPAPATGLLQELRCGSLPRPAPAAGLLQEQRCACPPQTPDDCSRTLYCSGDAGIYEGKGPSFALP